MTLSSVWRDRIAGVILGGFFLLVLGSITGFIFELVQKGVPQISTEFLTRAPEQSGRSGGIFPILVSTFWIMVVALGAAIPVSLGAAIFISEFSSRDSRFSVFFRGALDVLAAVPSIVYGLFGSVFFSEILGFGFSILSGGLTLACMILPLLIRVLEASLQTVSMDYRLAAQSLGLSQWTTVRRLILPSALPGLLAGLTLGIARSLSETAALLFTSGYVDRIPESLLDSGRSISIHIYDLAMNVPGGNANAYGSTFVLLILLFLTYQFIFLVTSHWRKNWNIHQV